MVTFRSLLEAVVMGVAGHYRSLGDPNIGIFRCFPLGLLRRCPCPGWHPQSCGRGEG